MFGAKSNTFGNLLRVEKEFHDSVVTGRPT